jgi:serine/threonine-protein kinase
MMEGKTVGHFKVIEKIGTGGMGIVYKAQDLTLDRMVALKSLPPGAIDDREAIARLIQEARTASILDHPNICTIHEISQTPEGQVFVAMAYYEGETLSQKLRRGPLPPPEAVGIAMDVALGLAKAHRHGVIHRDIKPGNIIVTTDGVVKILDFGVAQLASMTSTRTGTAGTVAYMSPEQLHGEPVDQRTDIWAWGIVLFEMLCGRAPFRAEKRRALMRAILSEQHELTAFLESTVPSGLVQVLSKALQKDPAERYLRIDEALSELQRSGPPGTDLQGRPKLVAGVRAVPSIAVLPFRSLSADAEHEYFSPGLTEELTGALARLDGLQVASPTAVIALKGVQGRAETAARLGVGLVLEGSLRRSGSKMRIHVQLIDVAEERVLWSEGFDRDVTDIFAVQEEIAAQVVGLLKGRLTGQATPPLVKRYTQNLRAYNLYLKGRYQWNRASPEALFKAVETLEQATAADPGYVLPFCGLAECYMVMGERALLPPAEAWRKARDASNRALELDPTHADAHGCLGAVLAVNDFNWAAAEREFRQGLELNPESALTHHWYAIGLLTPQGRLDEALAEITRAIECEPLSLIYNSTLAWIYYLSRQFKLAAEQCAKTLEIDPHHPDCLWCLGATSRELGQPQEALAALKKLEEIDGGLPLVYGSLGHSYAAAGNTAEAERMLRAVQEAGRRNYSSPICESWIHANLPGHEGAALDCLEKAYADRDFLIRYIHISPSLAPLYNHPRFHALVHGMGLDDSATESMERTGALSSNCLGRDAAAGGPV